MTQASQHRAPAGRRWLWAVAALVSLCVAGIAGAAWWIASLGPPPLGENLRFSTVVLDREGRLLRPFATPEGRWRLPARIEDVDRRFIDLLIAYEDRRFRDHRGVDPASVMRAAWQFVSERRVVSGASTLTMQVARLIEPRGERSIGAKLRQMVRAVEIERALSKDEILTLYLNLAPYGGNLEGIRAAALSYFGKEPRRLTLGEAALLVALPQSPEARRPDRAANAARLARERVLDRAQASGVLAADDVARARLENVRASRHPMPMLAPLAAEAAVADNRGLATHRLTIDAPWQRSLEDLARERARALGPDISMAILAVDHASGEILASVGSADYFDARRAGQVDMTRAVRSPGSTLKPFIYGLGFEDGMIHPETLIDDRPVRYGDYAPENFDLTFQGTVTVRKALQLSLNVPAVAVLDKVGPHRLASRLAQAGGALVLPRNEVAGLAMGLGGVGIRLTDLVTLYGGIARLGSTVPLRLRMDETSPAPRRLIETIPAWYVAHTLLGTPPPENAAGGRIAFKTGTSYGYRDAWAVGFDGKRTIGVWVGRPNGMPVPGLVGRSAAAPVLFEAFARLGKPFAPLPHAPRHAIIAGNSKLPPPLQRFHPGAGPSNSGSAVRIMFPPQGSRLDLMIADGKYEPIALKISGGMRPLTVLVNGAPVAAPTDQRTVFYAPPGPGFLRLTVLDAQGTADSVVVRVQ
jgi:penicillin-binding protein 1C